MPVTDVRVRPGDDVAAGLVEGLPERLALALVGAVARSTSACCTTRAPSASAIATVSSYNAESMTSSSSSSGSAPASAAGAPSHDVADGRGFVERGQDQGDGQPLRLLELRRRPRSWNSQWWNSASPNQRSTLAGRRATPRRRDRRLPASPGERCSKSAADRLRVLTTMTVGCARWAIVSGRPRTATGPAPRAARRRPSRRGPPLRLPEDRRGDVRASRRIGGGAVTGWRAKVASARSAWARTAR